MSEHSCRESNTTPLVNAFGKPNMFLETRNLQPYVSTLGRRPGKGNTKNQ